MNATKLLGIAVSIFVVILFLSTCYYLYEKGKVSNNNASANTIETYSELQYGDLSSYLGKTIYGSEVKYLLTSEDCEFRISTDKCSEEYFTDFESINDATSDKFVDQSDTFYVSGIYLNETLVGLWFKEVSN